MYGATNSVGENISKVLAKHGYSLILVDSSLDKLQHLQTELLRVFPRLSTSEEGSQKVELVHINFALWRDSTSLEFKVREVFTSPVGSSSFKKISIFVNASGFAQGPWQACEDKLYHEV